MGKELSRRNFLRIAVVTSGAATIGMHGSALLQAQESGSLTFWQPIDNHYAANDYFSTQMGAFQEQHPDVDVELVEFPFPGFEAKFLSAFAGRVDAPDIFVGLVAPWAGCIGVADEMPEDLVTLCEAEIIPAFHQVMQYDGRWYGYPDGPTNGLGSMLYYNADHFEAAGISEPPRTMDELYEVAQALVAAGGEGRVAFAHRATDARGAGTGSKIIPFLHAFGGKIYDLENAEAVGVTDSPESVAGLAFARKLVDENLASADSSLLPEQQFAAGQASMIFRESFLVGWLATNAPDINYGVSIAPRQVQSAMGATGVVDWAMMVNRFSPLREAAWDFIRTAVATQEADVEASILNGSPIAWTANLDVPHMQERRDYQALRNAAEDFWSVQYTHARHQELGDRHALAIQEVLLQGTDPEAALTAAAGDMQAIMDLGPCG